MGHTFGESIKCPHFISPIFVVLSEAVKGDYNEYFNSYMNAYYNYGAVISK